MIISLMSASGAPGVTTAALTLALVWPRPTVLVEADPAGGSAILAGYLRGMGAHDKTIVDLAIAHRNQMLEQSIQGVVTPIPDTTVKLIPAIRSHAQAASMAPLWESLVQVFGDLEAAGTDVIVDGGRLGMEGFPMPLVAGSDMVLLTCRTTLPALVVAQPWSRHMRELMEARGAGRALGLYLVGPGRPHSTGQVAAALGLPVVATSAFDPVTAEMVSLGAEPRRGFEQSPLFRSARAAVEAINQQVARNRAALASEKEIR